MPSLNVSTSLKIIPEYCSVMRYWGLAIQQDTGVGDITQPIKPLYLLTVVSDPSYLVQCQFEYFR